MIVISELGEVVTSQRTMSSKETPHLTVFRGFGKPGAFTWSPFVIKLEARLRFARLAYHVDGGSPKHAPRGKIPYVELRGESLSDSTFIIKHLVQEGLVPDLNGEISPIQRA